VKRAYRSAMVEMTTSNTTNILLDALNAHQPPLVRGRRIKLRYAHPGGHNPPVIVIHGNQIESEQIGKDYSPLMCAASLGYTAIVEYLIEHGAEVDFTNSSGVTALYLAAENGHTHTIVSLVHLGANPNHSRSAPLHAASNGNHLQSIETLVRLGADIDRPLYHDGRTPLNEAVCRGVSKPSKHSHNSERIWIYLTTTATLPPLTPYLAAAMSRSLKHLLNSEPM